MAYTYLVSAFIGMAATRLRHRDDRAGAQESASTVVEASAKDSAIR